MTIADDLRAARRRCKLSRSGLALLAGLHKDALRYMDDDGWNPTMDTIEKIKAVLDARKVDICTLAAGSGP